MDGEPIARRDLSAKAVRLAARSKLDARLAGKTLDPSTGVPGVIDVEAAGELPLSRICPMLVDWQSAGFRNYSYRVIQDFRDPPEAFRGDSVPSIVAEKSDIGLPDELRTLPIRLEADGQGNLDLLKLGDREFPNLEALKVEIGEILGDPALRFDRARLMVDEGMHYSELILVFKMLAGLKLGRIDVGLVRAAAPG